jgi:acyl-coenzyme A thioesterase PaaI-like protein
MPTSKRGPWHCASRSSLPSPIIGAIFKAASVVALVDVLVSVAAYAKRQWCPTVEIKTTFVAPLKLGECRGEARVIKAGKTLAFLEARLWGTDDELAIHATATVSVRA